MTINTTIIVHGGQPHRDDLLAACVAAIAEADPKPQVERRDPTPDELADRTTWVLDVGGVLDPARRNIDHHQDRQLPAAVHLLVGALAEAEAPSVQGSEWWARVRAGLQAQAWWQATSDLDTRGPFATGKALGFDPSLILAGGALRSPIEDAMLDYFASHPSEAVAGIIPGIEAILFQAADLADEIERFIAETARWQLPGGSLALVMSERPASPVTTRVVVRRNEVATGRRVAVVVSPDDRGSGWACLRWQDHPAVDLAPLAGDERVLFAHAGGFMLKTRVRLDIGDLLDLLARGVTP